MTRVVLVAGLLVIAQVLDATLLSRLHLPGASPALVLLVVVAMGLLGGSLEGAATGAAAGLLADLTPPAAPLLGVSALVLAAAGAVAGLLHRDGERSALAPMVAAGMAALVAALVRLLLVAIGGGGRMAGGSALGLLATTVLYALVLAPFVIPAVVALERRLTVEEWA